MLDDEQDGMDFMALVDAPAHMKSFEYFKDEPKHHFNEEQRIVEGVGIAVDLPIYRRDQHFGEHYVVFNKKTTRAIVEKMMKSGYMHNINEMHEENKKLSGITMIESYFIDRKRGKYPPETFKNQNLQDGTWMVAYKVDDQETWEKIKKGQFVGFSIEGWFSKSQIKTKHKMKKTSDSLFFTIFKRHKETFGQAETVDGVTVVWEGDLEEGKELKVKTEDGETLAPEGVHSIIMEEKTINITVDGNGLIASVSEENSEDMDEELAEILQELRKEFKAELKTVKEEFAKENEALKKENQTFKTQIETLVEELDKDNSKKFNQPKKKTWRNFTK